jgi:hypothetical protein
VDTSTFKCVCRDLVQRCGKSRTKHDLAGPRLSLFATRRVCLLVFSIWSDFLFLYSPHNKKGSSTPGSQILDQHHRYLKSANIVTMSTSISSTPDNLILTNIIILTTMDNPPSPNHPPTLSPKIFNTSHRSGSWRGAWGLCLRWLFGERRRDMARRGRLNIALYQGIGHDRKIARLRSHPSKW